MQKLQDFAGEMLIRFPSRSPEFRVRVCVNIEGMIVEYGHNIHHIQVEMPYSFYLAHCQARGIMLLQPN